MALVLLGALWLLAGPREAQPPPLSLGGPQLEQATGTPGNAAPTSPRRPRRVVVHVAGAVRRPGVYRLNAPGRLIDAVDRAGGLTKDADLTQINLAARLTDGRQIVVPKLAAAGGAAGPAEAGPAPGTKLSVNSASAEQLDTLDGVGPATAQAIVVKRTELGGFTSLDQLDEVDGIGEKRLAALRGQLEL